MKATEITSFILIATSLVVLILEAIDHKNTKTSAEKPHIRLLSGTALCSCLLIVFFSLNDHPYISSKPYLLSTEIATFFLIINTLIALFIIRTPAKHLTSEAYFLTISSLALAAAQVNSTSMVMKLLTSTAWLAIMTTLAISTAKGGKKAEIGLKMSFIAIINITLFLLAIIILVQSNLAVDLKAIVLKYNSSSALGMVGMFLIASIGLLLCGCPPFHFAHIDCADGSNLSSSFLFLSNGAIQGSVILLQVNNVFITSTLYEAKETKMLAFMLILGFMILLLRALDQSKIRRTAAYLAASVGPLFALSLLFGVSLLLPKLIFLMILFSFVTLSLFCLFGSLLYMAPLSQTWQTWEEMSGLGRTHPWQMLTFLVSIASIAGLPGTLGYFIKLSLIAPLKSSIIFSGSIFLSIAIGAACTMRVFVFAFSKHMPSLEPTNRQKPHIAILISSIILLALGFFPFVR